MSQRTSEHERRYEEIPISELEVWTDVNVRKHDVREDITELAQNIREVGLISPLLVTPKGSGQKGYWVISGQRRLIAARMAGLSKVPSLIVKSIRPLGAMIASFSENVYRREMTADDNKSEAAGELLRQMKGDKAAAARRLGVTVDTFNNYLGYIGVDPRIKEYVRQKKMNYESALKIHRKFQNPDTAFEVAKTYAEAPKNVKRNVYAAVREAPPDTPATQFKELAKKKAELIAYTVYLPPITSNTIQNLARDSGESAEDILAQIIEQWIDSFKKGLTHLNE